MFHIDPNKRKNRILILFAVIWLIASLAMAFSFAEHCYDYRRCSINVSTLVQVFLLSGALPISLILGVVWVLAAPKQGHSTIKVQNTKNVVNQNSQTKNEKIVICPTCKRNVDRVPGQIDFKCSFCNTAFRY